MSTDTAPDLGKPDLLASSEPVLRVHELSTTFRTKERHVLAVRSVSFEVDAGETLVLLGESGSGKSVTARAIMRLHGPRAVVDGDVRLNGVDLLALPDHEMRALRGSRVALVPQDPSAALDPLRRVGSQIVEVIVLHKVCPTRATARDRALDLLKQVGIPNPTRTFGAFPHELSGGMRQRVAIAIAISCDPTVIIADEPTTALDVTVQAQILELFASLQARLGTALLMVTHDVGVAADIADHVAVMYAGSIVESGPGKQVLGSPRHPYTAALLGAVPTAATPRGGLLAITGSPPTAGHVFTGCAFASRCTHARSSCTTDAPTLVGIAPHRMAACPVINHEPIMEGTR